MHPDVLLIRMSSVQGMYGVFHEYFMYQNLVIQSLYQLSYCAYNFGYLLTVDHRVFSYVLHYFCNIILVKITPHT
jgi:hypothetical protein